MAHHRKPVPAKRIYGMAEWQKDFARAFAQAIPLEAVGTQARGPLLAADNDEPEIDESFLIRADSTEPTAAQKAARNDERAMDLQLRAQDVADVVGRR